MPYVVNTFRVRITAELNCVCDVGIATKRFQPRLFGAYSYSGLQSATTTSRQDALIYASCRPPLTI